VFRVQHHYIYVFLVFMPTFRTTLYIVKVKNLLDATKYAVSLLQHVSGTNMPIIRSTVNKQLPLLGGHTWKRYAK
jgi:hypothetical protein